MSSLFKKPLDDISIDDINRLIDEGYPEGTYVEYKQELPTNKGKIDPWMNGENRIGDYARNKLLTEVVAFVNGQGGYLIIGIEESKDKPPKAAEIKPVPRCAELAEKLRLQARDCIEPMLPLIITKEVIVDDNGDGLVIVYVPQSRIAPHRLMQNSECYVRRNDRSEKMTMREIQDLTLQRSNFMVDLDQQFKSKHKSFQELMKDSFRSKDCYGIRVTLIPMSSDIWIDQVYKNPDIAPLLWMITAYLGKQPIALDSLRHFGTHEERPILRGSRHHGETGTHKTIQEIYCNGTIEYKFLTLIGDGAQDKDRVYPEWVLSFAINAMFNAHQFRQQAGFPDIEYAMDVEISRSKGPLYLNQFKGGRQSFEIEANPLIFPRLSIGSLDEFPSVMKILYKDLWDSAGVESSSDFEIQIPEEMYEI